jgi:phosphate-selective porin OprO/OprP
MHLSRKCFAVRQCHQAAIVGWRAWELGARFSSIDLTDGPVNGGEMDIISLGRNWWLSPIFNVNLNYRFITNDNDGFSGDVQGGMGRVLLMLE